MPGKEYGPGPVTWSTRFLVNSIQNAQTASSDWVNALCQAL